MNHLDQIQVAAASPNWIHDRSWLDYPTEMVLSVDRVDLHSFLRILNETSTVVDLGMSDGDFARAMVSRFGCRVYGLEPEPSLFAALPDIDRVVKEQAAVSPTDEPVTLYMNTTQCASMLFDAADTSVTVAGTTLTSFLDRHD